MSTAPSTAAVPRRALSRALRAAVAIAIFLLATAAGAQVDPAAGGDPDAPSAPLPATIDESSDRELAATLRRRLEQIADIEGLTVRVDAGWVYLTGVTPDPEVVKEATSIVARTEGVVQIENEIEVSAAVGDRVAPIVESLRDRLAGWVERAPLVGIALLLVLLFALAARWVARWERFFHRLSSNRFLGDLVRQLVATAVFIVGLLLALELLDATALVGAVLGTAGLVGIAVGFAFKDLAENYITSLLLSVRQPFAPNDHVVIDGEEGKVIRLTSRATILMTLDGNHLRLSNSRVFKATILNYSRNPLRRFSIGVGVGASEDLVQAQRIGTGILAETDGVLIDPEPWAEVAELGDSNVKLFFHGWVDQREANFKRVRSAAVRRLKDALDEAGVDMPEPIYRVLVQEPARATGEETAARERRPQPPPRPHRDDEPEAVEAADAIDHQIAAERASQESADLLDDDAPQE